MKILIISYESWRDTNNGGNVLSNIFDAFRDADIAQIYCSGELPQNSICRKYFQISDSMLLKSQKGRALPEKDYSMESSGCAEVLENKVKNKIPSVFTEAALLAREFLWTFFNWKTPELEQFVCDFQPDIIFAPCYSYFHVSKLALYVKSIAGCPIISYISDDNYSLKRFTVSPFFWINRLITRKWIRRLFAECSLVYTMTDLQKKEYEAIFKCPMKILCKSADFLEREREIGKPIRLIYAGGLYLNRWKVLARLAEVLDAINKSQVKAQLHIFTGSKIGKCNAHKLNDGKNSFLHSSISFEELKEQYNKSDIAVHVEAFDLKNRLITRLSFSTKIIDCMNSGCAILAIGPCEQAGIAYLRDNNAAVCVHDLKDLWPSVDKLVCSPSTIQNYAKNALEVGKKYHVKADIDEMIKNDFISIISQNTTVV